MSAAARALARRHLAADHRTWAERFAPDWSTALKHAVLAPFLALGALGLLAMGALCGCWILAGAWIALDRVGVL